MTQYVQTKDEYIEQEQIRPNLKESKMVIRPETKVSSGKKWADMVPILLEGNLFDRAITAFRNSMTTLNLIDAVDNVVYWHGRHLFHVAFKTLFDWKVYGSNNFPDYGATLLISNHQSVLDPFLIGTGCPQEVRWMSKIQNFEMPIFKSILSFFGTFAVNREEKPTAVLDKAVDILNDGWCVGMFPGGTRSPDGSLAESFKTGAARIALRAKVPYIPACILGSRDVLPKNSLKMKFAKVQIRIGEPVFLPDRLYRSYTKDDISEITKKMHHQVDMLMKGEIDPVKKVVITPEDPRAIERALADQYDLSIS